MFLVNQVQSHQQRPAPKHRLGLWHQRCPHQPVQHVCSTEGLCGRRNIACEQPIKIIKFHDTVYIFTLFETNSSEMWIEESAESLSVARVEHVSMSKNHATCNFSHLSRETQGGKSSRWPKAACHTSMGITCRCL